MSRNCVRELRQAIQQKVALLQVCEMARPSLPRFTTARTVACSPAGDAHLMLVLQSIPLRLQVLETDPSKGNISFATHLATCPAELRGEFAKVEQVDWYRQR